MSNEPQFRGAPRWRIAGVVVALAGFLVAAGTAMAILSIDDADTAKHFTAGQDAIGWTAATVGIGIFAGACWLTVRLWMRPHERSLPGGNRWAKELPGKRVAYNEAGVIPFGVWWRKHGNGLLVRLAAPAGLAVLWGGKGTDVGAAVLVAIMVAALTVVGVAAWWSHATRAIAVGDGWIAWKPRCLRSWRLLYIEDLIEHRRTDHDERLLLTRADGTQLRLNPADLNGMVGAAIQIQVARHDSDP